MVKRYVTSIRQLPGLHLDRAVYQAWNEGDIAHTLDNKPVDANPYNPDTHGLLWRTWRRGWEGHSMDVGMVIPPPRAYFKPTNLIVVKYRPLRKIKMRLRVLLKGLFRHVSHHHHLPDHQAERE